MKKVQMRLKNFCEAYDIPYRTALEWVRRYDFPAHKTIKCWYVRIAEVEKWFEKTHRNSYPYA